MLNNSLFDYNDYFVSTRCKTKRQRTKFCVALCYMHDEYFSTYPLYI